MKKNPSYRKKSVRTSRGKIAYAVVTLNGKDQVLGRWNSKASKAKYDLLIAEWLTAGRCSKESDASLSVAELCVDYANTMKKRYKSADGTMSTEWIVVRRVLRDLRKTFGKTKAEDFKALRFKAIREEFVSQGLSRSVVNKYCRHIVRVFKLATENEKLSAENYQAMIAVESLRRGTTTAPETDKIKPVEVAAIDAAIDHLHSIAADMVRLQLLTGMRPGELCQLKPAHIDRSNAVWVFMPETHKNAHRDQSRAICLGIQAQEILRPYLLRDSDTFCFDPSEAVEQVRRKRNLERVTPPTQGNYKGKQKPNVKPKRKAGRKYTTTSYRRAIHRACDAAGIPRWSPNRIRKTAATNIRKVTGSLESAQAVLGHKSRSTTEKFYAEIDVALAAEVMAKIG